VSTLPSVSERVGVRLLDKQARRLNAQLGRARITTSNGKDIARPAWHRTVTGPTGSGKTTTRNSALMQLNDRNKTFPPKKIKPPPPPSNRRDPIEYKLDAIGRTQINTK